MQDEQAIKVCVTLCLCYFLLTSLNNLLTVNCQFGFGFLKPDRILRATDIDAFVGLTRSLDLQTPVLQYANSRNKQHF